MTEDLPNGPLDDGEEPGSSPLPPAAEGDGPEEDGEGMGQGLSFELHLTPLSAAARMRFAVTVARRLPATFAALGAGRIHPVHLRIIEDETSVLSDADAARADEVLAGAAPGMTFGEVRSAAHQLVLKLDPGAARKRKDAAKRDAQVRPFRESSGNAGMVAPGCRRPAARCDLDHTVPWDQGGMTCECGLAPLCRHHHRAKQAEGWHLEQPEPGILIWHTPSGRKYVTTPTEYTA